MLLQRRRRARRAEGGRKRHLLQRTRLLLRTVTNRTTGEAGWMDVYVCVQNEEMLRHHNMDRSTGADDIANRGGSMWKWTKSMIYSKWLTTEG